MSIFDVMHMQEQLRKVAQAVDAELAKIRAMIDTLYERVTELEERHANE